MVGRRPVIVGIPAYRERRWLPATLAALAAQSDLDFELWVCVNQPREALADPAAREAVEDNRDTLAWLARRQNEFPFRLRVLDATGERAPPRRQAGVGWARRFLFEQALADRAAPPLCVSLDADTRLDANYLAAVREAFARWPSAIALAAPYRHPLPADRAEALRMLRYELYLRCYQLNLWRIGSPYAFLPLGSALAFDGRHWRVSGGFPPRQAGEDFYFLQRLRKLGPVIRWIGSRVYPSARASDRAPFGTGAWMRQERSDRAEAAYPFYAPALFDSIGAAFARWPALFRGSVDLPIQDFLDDRLGGAAPFERMRRNFPDEARFVRACHERFDALRTLQCLRFYAARDNPPADPQTNLNALLARLDKPPATIDFHPDTADIAALDGLRDRLAGYEADFQRAFMATWDNQARW